MGRRRKPMNERGVAMLIVICMIGLLAVISLCLIMESGSATRVTSSLERRQSVFQVAEAGLRLALYGLVTMAPSPTFNNIVNPATSPPVRITDPGLPSYVQTPTVVGNGSTQPQIYFVGVSSVAPAGWMMNAQGDSSFYSTYYQAVGKGSIKLPGGSGNYSSGMVSELVVRVSR